MEELTKPDKRIQLALMNLFELFSLNVVDKGQLINQQIDNLNARDLKATTDSVLLSTAVFLFS